MGAHPNPKRFIEGSSPKDAANQHIAEVEKAVVRLEEHVQGIESAIANFAAPRAGVSIDEVRAIAYATARDALVGIAPAIAPGPNDHFVQGDGSLKSGGERPVRVRPAFVHRGEDLPALGNECNTTEERPGVVELAARRLHGLVTQVGDIRDRVNHKASVTFGSTGTPPQADNGEKTSPGTAAELMAIIDALTNRLDLLSHETAYLCRQL